MGAKILLMHFLSSSFPKYAASRRSKPVSYALLCLCTTLKHKESATTAGEEVIVWLSRCYSNNILLPLQVNWLWTRPPVFHLSSASVEANLVQRSLRNAGGFCPLKEKITLTHHQESRCFRTSRTRRFQEELTVTSLKISHTFCRRTDVIFRARWFWRLKVLFPSAISSALEIERPV